MGQREVFERQFGQIVDFIIEEGQVHTKPKIGDIVYFTPYTGDIAAFEVDDEMLYFKVFNLNDINLIIE